MTEAYEDIVHNGVVVGQRLVSTPEPVPNYLIAREDLVARFTPEQWFAGRQAAKTDALLCYALDSFWARPEIRLDHANTIGAIERMVALGIMTAEEGAAKLAPVGA